MAYVFDLGNPATNANPFPEFARLRAEDPVHWSPAMKAWIITRYADVKQVALNNKQISADRLTPFFKANPEYQRGSIESLVRYLNHWMVFRDPPDHTRLRRLFTKAFTPTAVANLAPNIEDIVAHLIDGMQAKARRGEPVDFIADFAYPLPASVIMDLLGVPRADLERVKVWSDDIALFIGTAQVAGNKYLRAETGAKAMSDYFRGLVEARTAEPTADMISQLVLARDDRDALSTDEIIGTCILLLFAGHETTTNLIGNGFLYSMKNREQWERLVARARDGRQRDRGMAALRRPLGRLRARRRRRPRDGRPDHPRRPARLRLHELGQPRSRGVRRSRALRHRPRPEPAHDLRPRHPFLPGRAAGAAGSARSPRRDWPSACRTSGSRAASRNGTIR